MSLTNGSGPGGRPRGGRSGGPRRVGMAAKSPITMEEFGRRLARLIAGLSGNQAHAEVTVIIQEGVVRHVNVKRGFLPHDLPDV